MRSWGGTTSVRISTLPDSIVKRAPDEEGVELAALPDDIVDRGRDLLPVRKLLAVLLVMTVAVCYPIATLAIAIGVADPFSMVQFLAPLSVAALLAVAFFFFDGRVARALIAQRRDTKR